MDMVRHEDIGPEQIPEVLACVFDRFGQPGTGSFCQERILAIARKCQLVRVAGFVDRSWPRLPISVVHGPVSALLLRDDIVLSPPSKSRLVRCPELDRCVP